MNVFDLLPVGIMIIAGITGCVFFALRFRDLCDVRIERRLKELPATALVPGQTSVPSAASLSDDGIGRLVVDLANRLTPEDAEQVSALRARLTRAGVSSASGPAIYCTAKIGLMLACPVIGVVVETLRVAPSYYGILFGAIGGGIGALGPSLWLEHRSRERQNTIRRSLPDFLDLLVACLESGASFQGSLQRVTDELREAHPLLGSELAFVQREIELGASPAQALRRFAQRSGHESVRALSTMIEQTQRFGTSLSLALRTHADMMRARREQRAEEQANRAAVKILIPTLLFIFPAIFVVMAGPAAIEIYEKLTKPNAAVLGQE